MRNKLITSAIIAIIAIWGAIWLAREMYHKTNTHEYNIVQGILGDVTVRRAAGIWFKFFPTVYTYPKASIEICSTQTKENDPFIIQFNNKSSAKLACQVGYRLDNATDEQLVALHQEVECDPEKLWFMVYTRLNTELQKVATQFDPSDVVGGEKFPQFEAACTKAVMHNADLLAHGIDINSFTIDGKPDPDPETKAQLAKQRDADLARRFAEATVKQLAAETEKERAEAARKTEHEKIEAQALMAKEKLDFERQRQNEVIAAEKKLELAKIAKNEAEVRAQQEAEVAKIEVERDKTVAEINATKAYAVAEIAKQTEAQNLERERLVAEQLKVAAEAKKIQIELSGAITEKERVALEIERDTKIGVAAEQAKTYAHWNPQVIQVSGGNGGTVSSTTSSLDGFLNMKAAEAALNMTKEIK